MRKKPVKKSHPYGPAMTALKPMQQRFVELWVENPGVRPTQLLRLAGHRWTDWACARTSYNWARDPKVLEAVREGSAIRLASIVPKALAALEVMIEIITPQGARNEMNFKGSVKLPVCGHAPMAANHPQATLGCGVDAELKKSAQLGSGCNIWLARGFAHPRPR